MTSESNSDSADGVAWALVTMLILLLVLGLLYFGGAFASRTIEVSANNPSFGYGHGGVASSLES